MDVVKGFDTSKSAFVGLKTELLKKQEEVKRIKDKQDTNKFSPVLKPKRNVVVKKSNKDVEKRNINDLSIEFEDDTDVLRKSREVLEAKARLYDKLKNDNSSSTSTNNSQYLIDFDAKQQEGSYSEQNQPLDEVDFYDLSNSSDLESDWVEFEDALGRTRKCLKKDLNELKAKDLKLASSLRPPTPPQRSQQLLSSDMRRELNRQKWEEQEAELVGKKNIHYQDVLFGEARAHGVAYYEFSTNEEDRFRQHQDLQQLRSETIEKQQAVEALHIRRQQQLKVRLAAARKRRQERLGLPFEEVELQVPEMTKPQCEEPMKCDLKISDMEENIKKIASVRPWDIGKHGANSVFSQEEWIGKKREERLEEFAPPLSLLKSADIMESINKHRNNFFCSQKATIKDEIRSTTVDCGSATAYFVNNEHFNLSLQSKNEESNCNSLLKTNSDSHLNQKQNSSFMPGGVRLTSTVKAELSGREKLLLRDRSNKSRAKINQSCDVIDTTKQNEAVQICSSETKSTNCLSLDASAISERSTKHFKNIKRKWAEIAPPATLEYFAGNFNSNKDRETENRDLHESLSAGLHYLQALTEKKGKTRVKGLLDIV